MSFHDAAGFLLVSSLRNRVRAQLKRLKQPKYLVFTAIGLVYFWRAFLGSMFSGNRSATGGVVIEGMMGAVAFLAVAAAWVFGGDKAALRFTEPEIAFFFTAPVSRRALVHFRLVRALLGSLFAAALFTLFRARLVANPTYFFVGIWIGLSTLAMHMTAAALTRASLAEHGFAGWKRRILTLLVIAAALGALVWTTLGAAPIPAVLTIDDVTAWWHALTAAEPLRTVLFVVGAPLRAAFAPDSDTFVAALPVALGLLAVQYVWAVSSNAAFEEAADEAAQDRAKQVASRRGGRAAIRRTKPLFALPAIGRPWVALTWKNVLATSRVLPIRMLVLMGIGVGILVSLIIANGAGGALAIVAGSALAGAAMLAVLGPTLVRGDLRMDVPNMDLLRSYPLRGRDLVMGALAGPAFGLIAFELAFLLLGAGLSLGISALHVGVGYRLAAVVPAACLLAIMTMAGLVVQNALVLYLPGWVGNDASSARGPEAMGRRALVLAGTLVVTVTGLIPVLVVGCTVGFATSFVAGPACLVFGGLAGAAMFVGELHLALGWLGRAFESFDLNET